MQAEQGIVIPPNEIRVLPTVALKDLGINPRADVLYLRNGPVHLVTGFDPQSRQRVYAALLIHPFVGRHFTDFLGAVAPKGVVGYGSEYVTRGDFDMPPVALGTKQPDNEFQLRLFKNLHVLHTQDPDIGPAYSSFIADSFPFWDRVSRDERLSNSFWYLGLTTLFRDRSAFGRQLFDHWVRKTNSMLATGEIQSMLALHQAGLLMGFVRKQQGYHDAKIVQLPNVQDFGISAHPFRIQPLRSDIGKLLKNYLMQLSEEEQIAFGFTQTFSSFEMRNNIWVDTTQRCINAGYQMQIDQIGQRSFSVRETSNEQGVVMRFLGNATVSVEDAGGTTILIKALRKNTFKDDVRRQRSLGANRWRLRGYQFSQDIAEAGLYPVIAVATDEDGRKRFLTQQEASRLLKMAQVPHAGSADVATGRALLVYAVPKIAQSWPKEMFLQHQGPARPMEIANAQVGVWVCLDSEKYPHARQLLTDPNSPLRKLEEHIGISASEKP